MIRKSKRYKSWKRKVLHVRKEWQDEFCESIRDIATHPVVLRMKLYPHHGNSNCYEHCLHVAYYNYQWCKFLGLDARSAARGAMLHDLFLYDWHTHAKETGEHFHGFTHPRVAMENAIRYFQIPEKEQNMILRHMWPLTPIPPKSVEGFVLLYADKFCGTAEVAGRIKHLLGPVLRPRQSI